jgi:hypothetical protein
LYPTLYDKNDFKSYEMLFGSLANSFESRASAPYFIGEIYWIQLSQASCALLFEERPPNRMNKKATKGAID